MRVGIQSIGVHLPPTVRDNSWWPAEIVEQWRMRQARSFNRAQTQSDDPLTDGAQRVVAAIAELKSDPFEGVKERRVLDPALRSSDMEVDAARQALSRAGVEPGEIDLLLIQSTTPNFVHVSNACLVHRELGLSPRCFSLATEGMCNSFLQQLTLAEQMILSGRAHRALLIQSSHMTCMCRQEDPFSAWFGDGATAVVVGPVRGDSGLLGHAHMTDGGTYPSVVSGVPGRRWHDEGRVHVYLEEPGNARRMFLEIPEVCRDLVEASLKQAHLGKRDVTFWAAHQGTAWFSRVTQEFTGLDAARRVETFSWAASLTGSNIPLVLAIGERDGLLRAGDVVGMFAGAAGMTGTAMILRWGAE